MAQTGWGTATPPGIQQTSRGVQGGAVRARAFTTIVTANLSLILITRSRSAIAVSGVRSPDPALLLVFAGPLLCLSLVLCVPGLMDLFWFGPLSLFNLFVGAGAGVLSVVWFEVHKYGRGWRVG